SNGDLNQDIEQQHVPDAEHHAIKAGAEESIEQMENHDNKTDATNEAVNDANAEEDMPHPINEATTVEGRREKKHKRSHRKKKRSHKKYSDTDSGAEDLEEVS